MSGYVKNKVSSGWWIALSAFIKVRITLVFHTISQVTPRLEELQLFRLQQESKSFTGAIDQREQTLKNTSRERRKSGSSAIDEQPPAKWQKYTSQNKKLHKKENTQGLNLAEANDGEEKEGKVEKKVNERQMKDTKNTTSRLYKDQCTAFVSNLNITVSRTLNLLLFYFLFK